MADINLNQKQAQQMANINIECPPYQFNKNVNKITFMHISGLINFVNEQMGIHTAIDPIYCFGRSDDGRYCTLVKFNDDASVVIAGSKAVLFLAKMLKQNLSWEAKDNDVYFLNSDSEFRYDLEIVDIVAKKATDVANLLAGFDLPCCRVAYNKNYIWASLQALRAILKGHYSAPKIYWDSTSLRKCYESKGFRGCVSERLTIKFYDRVAKYGRRGFEIHYDMPISKTTFIERLDPNNFSYCNDTTQSNTVPRPKLIDVDYKPVHIQSTSTDQIAVNKCDTITNVTKSDQININKPTVVNSVPTLAGDDVIDIVITNLAPLMTLTKQTLTIIDIMAYVATIAKERRLPLLTKVINTYPAVVKLGQTDLFNYIKIVNLLL